ncbi:MAG: TerB family tellurite resistance protein [Gammaproteobacteria bacterium]|nr:TerB family tellurite resistance protein [Gammaproteobacteria bacterium]
MNAVDILKEKHHLSKLTLDDIQNDIDKDNVLLLLMFVVYSDDDLDKREEKQLIEFVQSTLYYDQSDDFVQEKITLCMNKVADISGINDNFTTLCRELKAVLNKKQKKELLDLLIVLVQADREVSDEETELLNIYRKVMFYSGIGGFLKKGLVKRIFITCPHCGSREKEKLGSEVTNQYQQTVKESEGGRTVSNVYTFEEISYYYKCKNCWSEFVGKKRQRKK